MSSTMPKFVVPPVATTAKHRVAVLVEHARDGVAVQAPVGVDLGGRDVDVHHGRGRRDRRVRLGAAHDDPPRGVGAPRVRELRRRAASRAVTSAERLPIVPPCTKTPPAPRGRPNSAREPVQHLVLGVDRAGALHPRAAVDGGCRHHDVERQRGLGRGRGDEGEVAGVVGRHAGRREHVLEQRDRAPRADAVGGDRARGQPREVARRHRLVERHVLVQRPAPCVLEDVFDGVTGVGRDGVHLAPGMSRSLRLLGVSGADHARPLRAGSRPSSSSRASRGPTQASRNGEARPRPRRSVRDHRPRGGPTNVKENGHGRQDDVGRTE